MYIFLDFLIYIKRVVLKSKLLSNIWIKLFANFTLLYIAYPDGGKSNFMSKNLYYDDVKIIKKPLSAKLKLAFKFFLIILTFVACGFISVYLSDALTVGNISSLFVYGNKSIKTKETSLYAVTLGEYDTALEAERVGYGANIQGASGYVWEDEKFWVIGNIYSSISDAEKVVENLKDSKYNIEIKEIVFPKLALEFDDYENKDVSQIKEVFDLFDKVYENLYDYSSRLCHIL